jgi:hypothetical protein
MSSSKPCVFRLDFTLMSLKSTAWVGDNTVIDLGVADYVAVLNARVKGFQNDRLIYREIHVCYPTSYQERMNDDYNVHDCKKVGSRFTDSGSRSMRT